MFRKNQNVMIVLCVALGVAILIIAYLIMSRSSPPQRVLPSPPQKRQEPAHHDMPPLEPVRPTETQVGGKPAIVLFYADWCGHSKAMMPEWEKFKQMVPPGMFDVLQFEQKQNPDHIKNNGVRGFPVIRFYPSGFPSSNFKEHRGERTAEGLANFVKSGGGGQ